MLKLDPRHHDDLWLYDENHITNLIHQSLLLADMLFDCGVEVVFGPLISLGNLKRQNFVPLGIRRLLDPFLDDFSVKIYQEKRINVSFYGCLDQICQIPKGKIINEYIAKLKSLSDSKSTKRIVLGLGFSTDSETEFIANQAIDYYITHHKKPDRKRLIEIYFGFEVPPIDIFIRTNEVRASGGLTPLLKILGVGRREGDVWISD